jgi:hypothetical protein
VVRANADEIAAVQIALVEHVAGRICDSAAERGRKVGQFGSPVLLLGLPHLAIEVIHPDFDLRLFLLKVEPAELDRVGSDDEILVEFLIDLFDGDGFRV